MTQTQAINFEVGDTIILHRYALVGDGTVRRSDTNAKLAGFYTIVEVLKPAPEDEDQVILVDVETPAGIKTVDFMPSQMAEIT